MFERITAWVEQGGYAAVALLMFAENLFPPIPSELIMPLGGYAASKGDLNIGGVIAAGWAGSAAGATFWYGAARMVGCERIRDLAKRHGAWLTMSPRDVDRANQWFCRYGGYAVFGGRLVPAVRTLISVPAGASDMSFAAFATWTAFGTAIWCALLAAGGYALGSNFERIANWLGPVSNAIVALLIAWYLWRMVVLKRRQRRERRGPP